MGYPDAPVLVLSGELDSITTAAEGDLVAGQFPNARHIVVSNTFHVTAVGDRDDCAERILRAFVRSPGSERRVSSCAKEVEPVRALGLVPRTLADVSTRTCRPCAADPAPASRAGRCTDRRRRHGPVVEQLLRQRRRAARRHLQLHGYNVVKLRLKRYRLLQGLAVSGLATWDRDRKRMTVELSLDGAVHGRLRGGWHTRAVGAEARLSGVVGGKRVRLTFRAP